MWNRSLSAARAGLPRHFEGVGWQGMSSGTAEWQAANVTDVLSLFCPVENGDEPGTGSQRSKRGQGGLSEV